MHRGIIVLILFCSVLLLLFYSSQASAEDKASPSRTILIWFDGAQPEVIERLIRRGKLPWNGGFAKLIREGTKAEGMTAVLPTVTGTVDPANSLTNAVTAGGAANIYINLQGREPTGIVPLEQYEEYQKKIEEALKAVSDPVTNERVFEIILKKPREPHLLLKTSNFGSDQEKKQRGRERDFHAFGEDSGDVLVVTIPGYHLDFNAGTGTTVGDFFQSSTFFGQHGHDPRRPEMKAIFYAAGPDFKRRTLKDVANVDVAPTIAELLDIKPPKDSQGRKIQTRDDNRH